MAVGAAIPPRLAALVALVGPRRVLMGQPRLQARLVAAQYWVAQVVVVVLPDRLELAVLAVRGQLPVVVMVAPETMEAGARGVRAPSILPAGAGTVHLM